MAVTLTGTATLKRLPDGGGGNWSQSVSVPADADGLLVVIHQNYPCQTQTYTVTAGGVSMPQVFTVNNTDYSRLTVFLLPAPATGTITVAGTISSGSSRGTIEIQALKGVDPDAPTGTPKTADGTTANPSTGAFATTAGDFVLELFCANEGNAATVTGPTGYADIYRDQGVGPTYFPVAQGGYAAAAGASTTVTWTFPGAHSWSIGAVVINALSSTPLTAGTATAGTLTAWEAQASATDATGGTAPYTYQWQRTSRGGSSWGAVSGQTTRSLSDTTVAAGTSYDYRLAYTDSAGSPATVYSATLQIDVPALPAMYVTLSLRDAGDAEVAVAHLT